MEKDWKSFDVQGRKSFIVKEKQNLFKGELEILNKEAFAITDLNIDKLVEELNKLYVHPIRTIDDSIIRRRTFITKKFWQRILYKEISIRPKSKVRWIIEGNDNTRYFHIKVKFIKRRVQITAIKKEDKWLEGVNEINN